MTYGYSTVHVYVMDLKDEFTVNLPLLLLILISAFASKWLHTLSPGFCQWVLKKPSSAMQLRTDLASLKEELQRINITDNFAEHARLQRRITQKQRQLEDLEKKSSSAHLRRVVLLQGVCFVLIEGTRIGVIVSHRHDPVVQLPPHHLWPLSWVLAFPTGTPGAIGAPCWGLLSRQVTETVITLWSGKKT